VRRGGGHEFIIEEGRWKSIYSEGAISLVLEGDLKNITRKWL